MFCAYKCKNRRESMKLLWRDTGRIRSISRDSIGFGSRVNRKARTLLWRIHCWKAHSKLSPTADQHCYGDIFHPTPYIFTINNCTDSSMSPSTNMEMIESSFRDNLFFHSFFFSIPLSRILHQTKKSGDKSAENDNGSTEHIIKLSMMIII